MQMLCAGLRGRVFVKPCRFVTSMKNHLWIIHYLCVMRKLTMDELNRKSVDEFRQAAKNRVVVVLENIRSMQNVGSVFRTADAFLIEAIYLTGYTPQPPHRDIHKTALGATETVDWKYFATAADAIQLLRNEGYKV